MRKCISGIDLSRASRSVFGALCLVAVLAGVSTADDLPKPLQELKTLGASVNPVREGGWSVDFRSAADLNENAWKLLEAVPDVKQFSTGGEQFDDAQLARLSKLKSLQRIFLNGPSITDPGLAVLKNLPDLHYFGVHHSLKLTGVGVAALKDSPQLTAIEFGGSAVDDAGARAIVELKQLTEVKLGHVRITRASFPLLASLPKLQTLEITPNWDPAYYTPADFAAFTPMKNLAELEIHDMAIPFENGLDHLAGIESLKTLKLYWCYVAPADLEKLKAKRPDLKVDYDHAATEDKAREYEQRIAELEKEKK